MADAPEVTILLLGDEECGKTTLLSRISKGPKARSSKEPLHLLRDNDQPFIFDITFFNRPYRFELYDNNAESWTLLQPDVIVLCYDISSRRSLINVQLVWAKEVKRLFTSTKELPILLLGLKRDLRDEDDPNGIIYPQEAYRIAQEMRCDKYMECSAVSGELVNEVWEDICRTAAWGTKSDGGGLSQGGCRTM